MSNYVAQYLSYIRPPRLSLVLLFWHLIQIFISGFNWLYFLSNETSMIGTNLPRAHIAFNVMGMISYVLLASVFMFWPYRFGSFMLNKTRRNRLVAGCIIVYFIHVMPCWMMEFSVVWTYGWFSVLQGTSFLFLTLTWSLETLFVWLAYAWNMSGFMHNQYANTKFGRGSAN